MATGLGMAGRTPGRTGTGTPRAGSTGMTGTIGVGRPGNGARARRAIRAIRVTRAIRGTSKAAVEIWRNMPRMI